MKKFQDNQQYIVMLSGSKDDLLAALPSNNSVGGQKSQIVNSLKQSLGLLDKLIAERTAFRNELTSLSQRDDIAGKLVGASDDHEVIFAQELQKYESVQSKLQQNFSNQVTLMDRIQKENIQFVGEKASSDQSAQREQILQRLNTAFKIYNELKDHLREGIQFYSNFQELLKQFNRKCEDFMFARQTEKQDLLKQLQVQATGFNEASHPPQSYPQPTAPPGSVPGGWQPNMKPVYQQPHTPQAYPHPPQGYQQPPQGYPPQGYQQPPQGYPPQGYQQPPPGYPPQGYQQPPPGYPPQQRRY